MNCYKWELESILEGLSLKNIDEREDLAELAINMRYTMHAKKVSLKKMFDKRKEENKVINLFNKQNNKNDDKKELAKRIQLANEHFKNKNKK